MQQKFSWQRFRLIGVRYYVLPVAAVNLEIRFQNVSGEISTTLVTLDSRTQDRSQINSGKNFIFFSVQSFKEIEQERKQGATVTIAYKTEQGANNCFDIDIVYALPCENHEINSPIHKELKIKTATIENIISDKVSACHRFGSGNGGLRCL